MESPRLTFVADYDDKVMSEEVLEEFILEGIERRPSAFKLSSLQSFSGEYQKGEIWSKAGYICC